MGIRIAEERNESEVVFSPAEPQVWAQFISSADPI